MLPESEFTSIVRKETTASQQLKSLQNGTNQGQEERKISTEIAASRQWVENLLTEKPMSTYEFLTKFPIQSRGSRAEVVTAEQYFKPSLLLKNEEGELSPKGSYNIQHFDDMVVIGEGTYGKVYKAKLLDTSMQ